MAAILDFTHNAMFRVILGHTIMSLCKKDTKIMYLL